ncbi:DNA (cytosine-5)-methyltransferase 1 [Sporomusaceae bacterium BoRhaA]|uniref:DNA cytosine methyltransferase n=1 Tax=Pelorhabdus rhamnosifermentans TaxID=2772457 RepID=UPI001C063FDD|nr:DNA cytosine methyltransferase [Pelorhabdus rhamnosifermentans]MBU2704130.1 DNA (cytosine-5)-methyltransferase 1 [Pelorhabdus rhamnosifermentans]
MALKMFSLFSGIGGIDLAAQWAGIETVAFCEKNPFCQKVLEKHWPDVPIFEDIRKLNKEVLENAGISGIDIVAGGYPCQPYSLTGERKGEEDDRALWPYMRDLIQEVRPTWVIGENVTGHVSLGLDSVLSDLENINYAAQPFIIPAAGVGARHIRERVFTVANTNSFGLQGGKNDRSIQEGWQKRKKQLQGLLQADIRVDVSTSRVYGKPNGIPSRVDRCKSVGNAVNPYQIYPILAAIVEIEKARTC